MASQIRSRVPPAPDDDTFDAFAAPSRGRPVEDPPVDAVGGPRPRTRRGGPRTPVPLLPFIALVGGVAIAYVAQTAHLTQTTYQATQLAAQQSELRQQDQRLGDELDRLRSSARIGAAAQTLGLVPPPRWAYVPSATARITVPSAPGGAAPARGGQDAVQKLVAMLSGEFGPTQVEAAAP